MPAGCGGRGRSGASIQSVRWIGVMISQAMMMARIALLRPLLLPIEPNHWLRPSARAIVACRIPADRARCCHMRPGYVHGSVPMTNSGPIGRGSPVPSPRQPLPVIVVEDIAAALGLGARREGDADDGVAVAGARAPDVPAGVRAARRPIEAHDLQEGGAVVVRGVRHAVARVRKPPGPLNSSSAWRASWRSGWRPSGSMGEWLRASMKIARKP